MTQVNLKLEESLVSELRRRMKGEMRQELYEDDHIFERFLRARNHNIDAAETMLKNHITWRNKNKVDTILEDYIPNKFMSSEYFTISGLGTDLEGSRLSYLHFGHLDIKGMVKSTKRQDIKDYVIHYLETDLDEMKKRSQKTGQLVDKSSFIFNFEGFSLAAATNKQTIELYLDIISMYEANFPETLKRAYAINVSYYFFLMWTIIKPFFSAETARKIHILGKSGWQEDLLKTISPDVLPKFLGGNRTDPDGNPMCKTLIRFGGPVPESFFEYANKPCAIRIPNAKKLTVQRLSRVEVMLEVLYAGSTLEWEFVLKNKDIEFSVLYRDGSEARDKVVIPKQRIDTSQAPESGMYQCKKSGKYILEFDNMYSWLHGKEIYYTAAVLKSLTHLP